MLFKGLGLFAIITIWAQRTAAVPPACLLAAINTEPNPADLTTICGTDASKVLSQINGLCGSNVNLAIAAFVAACNAAGRTVAISSITATTPTTSVATSSTPISLMTTTGPSTTSPTSTSSAVLGPIVAPPFATGNLPAVTTNATTLVAPSHASTTTTAGQAAYTGAARRMELCALGVFVGVAGVFMLLL